jgi:DNA recombination protein RmuC
MELLGLGVVGVLAVVMGVLIGRYAIPTSRTDDRDALETARVSIARLEQDSTFSRNQLAELEAQRDALTKEIRVGEVEVAKLSERETSLQGRIDELTRQLAEQNRQLTTEFENIANRILKSNTNELTESSRKSLAVLLDPLRERILEFQATVEKTYQSETREVLSLKEQIKLVMETSNTIGNQADGLAKALRGDSRLLGRWGELVLERILTAAGLVEGREFITQGRGLGLRNQEGDSQRPDVIIMLPEERTMIIDSKVSLASYDRLIAARDENDRNEYALQFLRDMKAHIDGLSGKRYQENEKLQAHDCVLMFVPIEGALAAALSVDPELFVYAWDRRVVLVGPPTLLMTLRTVASIWRYEQQGQNAQEIARLAGDLCDKVTLSLLDLNTAADKIQAALDAHNEAVKRLSTGKGNALSLGERMRALGVATRRPAPVFIEDVPISAEPQLFDYDEAGSLRPKD